MPKVPATKTFRQSDGKETKKRSKKDPNKPKRGLSAYMFFSQKERDNVIKTNPKVSFGEIGKILGQQWKGLTPDQKKPYEELAAKDKARYEAERAIYEANV